METQKTSWVFLYAVETKAICLCLGIQSEKAKEIGQIRWTLRSGIGSRDLAPFWPAGREIRAVEERGRRGEGEEEGRKEGKGERIDKKINFGEI